MQKKQSKEIQPNLKKEEKQEPDFIFIPKGRHDWRQRGPYIVCGSCDLQHAVYIGMDQLLMGLDKNGKPILKKRKDIFKD